MKPILLFVGVAFLVLAGSAPSARAEAGSSAGAPSSGWIEAVYEHTAYEPDAFGSFDSAELNGAWRLTINGPLSLQADARYTYVDWSDSYIDKDHLAFVAAHATYANNGWAAAAFAGATTYFDEPFTMVGIEGRRTAGKYSFDLSAASGEAETADDAWGVRLGGSYLAHPNLLLSARAGYSEFAHYNGEVVDVTLEAECRFDGSPISVTTAFTHAVRENGTLNGYDANSFRLGVRVDLSGLSLQERVLHGANWTGAADFFNARARWD